TIRFVSGHVKTPSMRRRRLSNGAFAGTRSPGSRIIRIAPRRPDLMPCRATDPGSVTYPWFTRPDLPGQRSPRSAGERVTGEAPFREDGSHHAVPVHGLDGLSYLRPERIAKAQRDADRDRRHDLTADRQGRVSLSSGHHDRGVSEVGVGRAVLERV